MAVTHDTHANKALVRRYIEEVWDHQKNHNMVSKMAVADELLHDSFRVKGAPYRDKAGEKDFVQKHHHAYPDMTFTITHLIAEGDTVSVQIHGKGTHKGVWMGIPPTNKVVNVHGHVQFTVKDNKLTEAIHNVDVAGIRMDMGVMPPTEQLPRRMY